MTTRYILKWEVIERDWRGIFQRALGTYIISTIILLTMDWPDIWLNWYRHFPPFLLSSDNLNICLFSPQLHNRIRFFFLFHLSFLSCLNILILYCKSTKSILKKKKDLWIYQKNHQYYSHKIKCNLFFFSFQLLYLTFYIYFFFLLVPRGINR